MQRPAMKQCLESNTKMGIIFNIQNKEGLSITEVFKLSIFLLDWSIEYFVFFSVSNFWNSHNKAREDVLPIGYTCFTTRCNVSGR